MGCTSSSTNQVKNRKKVQGGIRTSNGVIQLSTEDLKRILLDRQMELASRAKSLLTCETGYRDDMLAAAIEADDIEIELGHVKESAVYKLAKQEANDNWMVFS